ncbi:MAG TPA: sigma-70 family RNA polymerase sigma factor [Conexibacter sp.]|nr:sigma-70 family RNA polymerase sigma factor [Conexibacter sp.]
MEHVSFAAAPAGARRSVRLLRRASDERLVALVRTGEDAAFAALYDRHHGAIFGFCRHMLGSREEAEDALQHTFLSAYRDLVTSDKRIDLRPWLFAIARNRCLSLLRARREHVALELAEPATDGLTATVDRREDLRELLADLARLPDDQRAALLLAELGALDHASIARVLDCPREKVKALVFQARSSLVASREARATPCEQIRVELATATGAALRRGPLRRHLRTCAGCRAFKAEVRAQRALLALALPVAPSAALKAGVLSSIGIGGHSGAASAGTASGALSGVLASSSASKVAVALALAGAVAGGGTIAIHHHARAAAHATSHAPAASGRQLSRHRARALAADAASRARVRRRHPPATAAAPPGPSAVRPGVAPQVGAVAPPSSPGTGSPGASRHGAGNATTPAARHRTPPGKGGTPPGHGGAPPGQGAEGRGGSTPGHGGTPPGHGGAPPGQGAEGSPPGDGGNTPGHGDAPGQG